jgi:hypothetical protein
MRGGLALERIPSSSDVVPAGIGSVTSTIVAPVPAAPSAASEGEAAPVALQAVATDGEAAAVGEAVAAPVASPEASADGEEAATKVVPEAAGVGAAAAGPIASQEAAADDVEATTRIVSEAATVGEGPAPIASQEAAADGGEFREPDENWFFGDRLLGRLQGPCGARRTYKVGAFLSSRSSSAPRRTGVRQLQKFIAKLC